MQGDKFISAAKEQIDEYKHWLCDSCTTVIAEGFQAPRVRADCVFSVLVAAGYSPSGFKKLTNTADIIMLAPSGGHLQVYEASSTDVHMSDIEELDKITKFKFNM